MRIEFYQDHVRLCSADNFDPADTFECGQCFRWNRQEDESYIGVAHGRAVRVEKRGADVLIYTNPEDFNGIWHDYFDLGLDYAKVASIVSVDHYTEKAARFARGMRILKQDKWEALCSFIISQNNNMDRIKSIIERLCALCGRPFYHEEKQYFPFPEPAAVASLSPCRLASIGSGYRARYILEAARAVCGGSLDLEALDGLPFAQASERLQSLPGVGKKVAECVLLFGFHRLDSFPVDTWIKKALQRHYPADFDPSVFSPYAGIAQQYIFHYIRTTQRNMARSGENKRIQKAG